MTLYAMAFKNYYNRKLKKVYGSIGEYQTAGAELLGQIDNVNFNPNDGVMTSQVINLINMNPTSDKIPDYVLLAAPGSDGKEKIVSRWYIIEMARTMSFQYTMSLYRDLLADYWESINKEAIVFIEKAMLPASNELIFNSESMTFNQILRSQDLIKDKTGSPWIVGYLPRDYPGDQDEEISAVSEQSYYHFSTADNQTVQEWIQERCPFISFEEGALTSNGFTPYPGLSKDDAFRIRIRMDDSNGSDAYVLLNDEGRYITGGTISESLYFRSNIQYDGVWPEIGNYVDIKTITSDLISGFTKKSNLRSIFDAFKDVSGCLGITDSNSILNLNDQLVKDSISGEIYRINLVDLDGQLRSIQPTFGTALYDALMNTCTFNQDPYPFKKLQTSTVRDTFGIEYRSGRKAVRISLAISNVKVNLRSTRAHCKDAPFDIFCMPYGELLAKGEDDQILKTSPSAALSIANAISAQTGLSGSQFDIQLLPFCPVPFVYEDAAEGEINLKSADYEFINDAEGVHKSLMIWLSSAEFNISIDYLIETPEQASGGDAYDVAMETKVMSETEIWRLCSPNYNGIFEFNVAKNRGVQRFNVAATLRPYSPFIQIRPNFGGLYGIDPVRDNRGLILGGDFSLAQMTDAWATYQLNNKNYQATFDRQIEHMEIVNRYQHTMDIINATTGTLAGAAGGAMMGAKGGAVGAIVGGVAGAAAAGVGGALDVYYQDMLRNEAIDLSKDQFGYTLGNIQAIPQSISKTSALVANNKLFPFIEHYSATEIERQALRDKIRYNGMTVMAIGRLSDYKIFNQEVYVKAKLIRLDTIQEDYQVINAIAGELNKGVYI